MQPIKILTTHLHRGITKKDIAFYKALHALGELYVAIPDDESYQELWQKSPPARYALEQRRAALEACLDIALVFDVRYAMPFEETYLEKVCRDAFLTIGINAWACKRNSDMHPVMDKITEFMAQQRIPIISVNCD